MASALAHLHLVGVSGRAVLHHDVKPSNVLLSTADHAYIADFGLSKAVRKTGQSKSFSAARSTTLVSSMALKGTQGFLDPQV